MEPRRRNVGQPDEVIDSSDIFGGDEEPPVSAASLGFSSDFMPDEPQASPFEAPAATEPTIQPETEPSTQPETTTTEDEQAAAASIRLRLAMSKGKKSASPWGGEGKPADGSMADDVEKTRKLLASLGQTSTTAASSVPPQKRTTRAFQRFQQTMTKGMERTVAGMFGIEKEEDRQTALARSYGRKWMAKTFVKGRAYKFSQRWKKQAIFFDKKEEVDDEEEEEALLPFSDVRKERKKIVKTEDGTLDEKKKPYVTYFVTFVQVVILWVAIFLNSGIEPMEKNPFAGPKTSILLQLGGLYGPYVLERGEWWRFFTSIFLHVGLLHLVFNLSLQLTIVKKLEWTYGWWRIAIIYLIAGIGGNVTSAVFLPDQLLVGCSGSLYGFFGVLVIDCFQHWKLLKRPWKNLGVILGTILASLLVGLLPGVDNFAHVGGFLFGALSAIMLLPNVTFGKWVVRIKAILGILSFLGLVFLFLLLFLLFAIDVNPHGWCKACKYITCIDVNGWCDGLGT